MSGMWKRKGTARRKGQHQICSAYSHRATFRLYHRRWSTLGFVGKGGIDYMTSKLFDLADYFVLSIFQDMNRDGKGG
jgi:hypothetical protein